MSPVWSGAWVGGRLGVRLTTTSSPFGLALDDLVGLALRRNPRRAHLLVSRVLAKHVPTDPRLVRACALLLGALVRQAVDPQQSTGGPERHRHLGGLVISALADGPGAAAALREAVAALVAGGPGVDALVLGYAETATALGHDVAEALGPADYLHSTRRPVPGVAVVGGFEESHSHATSHLLLPRDRDLLTRKRPLVLVDDELSTGSTVLNTIAALHQLAPRRHYVVAALVDLRSAGDQQRMERAVAALGARLDVVALVTGTVDLPGDALERGTALVGELSPLAGPGDPEQTDPDRTDPDQRTRRIDLAWPDGVPEGGRHGLRAADRAAWRAAIPGLAAQLDRVATPPGQQVLVLGTEELMAAPLQLAEALADLRPDLAVQFSSTTRSPALPIDDPGYALRSAVRFAAHDDPADAGTKSSDRFAYNVAGTGTEPRFDRVVLVTDKAGDTAALAGPDGLLTALARVAPQVGLVVLPTLAPPSGPLPVPLHGPAFGSYPAAEVSWLLTDLSHVELEAPTAEREAAIQAGTAHYAESLPQEYQPDAEYQQLFVTAVTESAARIAHAVGVVSEILLAERGPDLALASLARAGTPVGILIRRWLSAVHGVAPTHYTLSIVRGRGIDEVALGYLAARHRPRDVVFVDGWTGKGAIARELSAALADHATRTGVRFDDTLAVLADPGRCATTYGTRDDFLIPSACLNSTVSGLVSRTVLNDELIGPGQFHGAKFYAELAPGDVSVAYLDAVSAQFDAVRDDVASCWPVVAASDRRPTWTGWAAVERISREYGIGQVNLVKPGVGETTRVLLRRVPERVLVRAGSAGDLPHVLLLARRRGVPVEEVADLPYSCVGLIRPHSGGEG